MTTIRRQSLWLYSVLTAFIYAFILSGIYIAYAVAVTLLKFGVTETQLPWYIVAVSFSTVIAIYTSVPKPPLLLRKNAGAILLITALSVIWIGLINSHVIIEQFGMVLYFSIYTLLFPIILPVLAHIVHRHSNLIRKKHSGQN